MDKNILIQQVTMVAQQQRLEVKVEIKELACTPDTISENIVNKSAHKIDLIYFLATLSNSTL